MYLLATQFNIRPWEINEDGEVYKDDLTTIIALKYIENAAAKVEAERASLERTIKK